MQGPRCRRRGPRDPPLFSVVTASEPVFQTLLVAHDFSPSSNRALAHAVDLAARTGAALHLMYVDRTAEGVLFEGGKAPPDDELQDRFEERCHASLAPHDRSPAEDRVVCHAVRGVSPAPLLVEKAEEIDADLIVTGTEGRRGARRLIVGSVAEEVLRTAPCPVLTVRQREAGGASGSTGEADDASSSADDASSSADEAPSSADEAPSSAVEQIVAPVDFSDLTEVALRHVAQLAPLYDVPVTLVHVVEDPTMPSVYEVNASAVRARAAEQRAEEALQSLGAPIEETGVSVSYLVHRGQTTSTVVEATGHRDTLTVMGTKGLSGLRRVMLGSVTEAVIRASDGPVLAVPASAQEASPANE
jgi:nucleotide-binding universal stress UspA family protein